MKINTEEFERLASENHGGLEFFDRILKRLVSVTGANAGIYWNCDQSPFFPLAQHSAGDATPIRMTQEAHENILNQVFRKQQSTVVRPNKAHESPVIILAPINGLSKGLVELIVPSRDLGNDKQILGGIDQVCEVIGKHVVGLDDLKPQTSQASESNNENPNPVTLERFAQFVAVAHKSIDRKLTCSNIANESRLLLDCDRVSVVVRHRGKFKIFAISGQPSVNRRSNTVHSLEKLAQQVLKSKKEFWYPSESELAPQLSAILDEYMLLSATRSLVIQPIWEKVTEVVEDPESNERKHNPIIGGVIYEHCNEQWERTSIAPTLNFVTQHSGSALRNAKKHNDLFLYPVWNILGKSRVLAGPRMLPKTLLALGAIILVSLFLAFWPAKFYVSAKGVLLPEKLQRVFPKTSGDVEMISVSHKQTVNVGDTLVVLKSEELQLRLEDVIGRLETLRQRQSSIERQQFDSAGIPAANAEESLESIQTEIDSLNRQLEKLEQIKSKLTVKSPIQGEVITFDLQQKLKGRTVSPQNLLMEIADTNGAWQLRLDVEDRRVNHLLEAIENSETGELRVQFALAADPGETYEGSITEVSNAIQLNGDNEQVLQVKVELDEDAISLKQAKTGVSAKIYTGEVVSFGYLWLHDIPETLHRYVFFYFAN